MALSEIAVKVRLADAVVRACDAALHDGEEALRRVDVDVGAKADVLVCRVVHRGVVAKLLADLGVDRAFVGH